MKKTNTAVMPLFVVVVALLAIGAAGEQLAMLFSKVKSLLGAKTRVSEGVYEVSKQLK